ncbi:13725_t:CDS:2, partial [Rhizophagus irregularis]
MSQQNTGKPDVEALENAASVIQPSKAKSLADKAADMYDESGTATINKKINLKNIDDAARTIQREESKICGGETPSSGA